MNKSKTALLVDDAKHRRQFRKSGLVESLAAFLFAVWFFFLEGGYWLMDLAWHYHVIMVAAVALVFFVYEVLSGNYYRRDY